MHLSVPPWLALARAAKDNLSIIQGSLTTCLTSTFIAVYAESQAKYCLARPYSQKYDMLPMPTDLEHRYS